MGMIGHLLNSTVTVYRATYVTDAVGGRTKTFAEVDTVRAMVAQPGAEERNAAAQRGAELDHVIYVEHGANVERGDELDNGGARRLRVTSIVTNSRATYARLECQVVQGE
jgi:SPP1 family predicted phage head-tail adaptor